MKSMMMKAHLPTRRRVMMDTIQNQMKLQLKNPLSSLKLNTRLKPLLQQQPRRTQNKSSLNNSKRSKAKHPSYQSRENKQLQRPRFWNRLSSKAGLALSLTGHRLSQSNMPMLVARSQSVASRSLSWSPRKPWEPMMAWVTGKLLTKEKPQQSRKKILTATKLVLFHLTKNEEENLTAASGIILSKKKINFRTWNDHLAWYLWI